MSEIIKLPAAEIDAWVAYRKKHGPFDLTNHAQAQICQLIAQAHFKGRFRAEDFLLRFGEREGMSLEVLRAWCRGIGRKQG